MALTGFQMKQVRAAEQTATNANKALEKIEALERKIDQLSKKLDEMADYIVEWRKASRTSGGPK